MKLPSGKLRKVLFFVLVFFAVQAITEQKSSARDAGTSSFVSGVNLPNPQWKSEEFRKALLDEVAAAKVKFLRYPYQASSGEDFTPIIEFTIEAYRRGARALLIVFPQFGPSTRKRPAVHQTIARWDEFPLSEADEGKFRTHVADLFAKFDAAGVKLAGVEFDNELNWAQFNGDFNVPSDGKTLTLKDLKEDPEGQAVAQGYDKYIALLRILYDERNHASLNHDTPIVLGGLAQTTSEWPSPKEHADAVSISATLDYLRERGLDSLVDFYGVHSYAGVSGDVRGAMAQFKDAFSQCYSLSQPGHKPCWLTEWGLYAHGLVCPVDDRERAATARELMSQLAVFIRTGALNAQFYYDWRDPETYYGIYLCGALTETGKAILRDPRFDSLSETSREKF